MPGGEPELTNGFTPDPQDGVRSTDADIWIVVVEQCNEQWQVIVLAFIRQRCTRFVFLLIRSGPGVCQKFCFEMRLLPHGSMREGGANQVHAPVVIAWYVANGRCQYFPGRRG